MATPTKSQKTILQRMAFEGYELRANPNRLVYLFRIAGQWKGKPATQTHFVTRADFEVLEQNGWIAKGRSDYHITPAGAKLAGEAKTSKPQGTS